MNRTSDRRKRRAFQVYVYGSITLTMLFAYLVGYGSYKGILLRNLFVVLILLIINSFIASWIYSKNIG